MANHPLLLDGTELHSWETFIPENLNLLFNSKLVKDIIRLAPGKYIVTFNSVNSILCGLYSELYTDNAKIVFTSDFVFDVSIADISNRRYTVPQPFKTAPPYLGLTGPIILYKGSRRRFSCEWTEK